MKIGPAVQAIEEHGILLVYPLANRREPRSLWSVLHPGLEMRWAWDAGADAEVADIWRLRERLARSSRVVYAKWYQGRATFFSKGVFTAMLARMHQRGDLESGLGRATRELLGLLDENSPVSTKDLRTAALESGLFARRSAVDPALKPLWERLLAVGTGEVDDGAFPSLMVGATSLVWEPLWEASHVYSPERDALLERALTAAPSFARYFAKVVGKLSPAEPLPL